MRKTKYDGNEINCHQGICKMYLYNKNNEEIAKTYFSESHLREVKKLAWHLDAKGYANSQSIKLHQLIMGKKEGFEIDHIDNNPLNNLDNNLRHATHSQNLRNRKALGIWFNKERNNWEAYIMVFYKKIHLGSYKKREDALSARKKAELKYFEGFNYTQSAII